MYNRRIVGITIAGTREEANAAINARFGPNAINFGTPVGPTGVDAVTHWLVASKTRSDVLGVFASETQQLHGGAGTSKTSGPEHQTITRDADGAILGAWSTCEGGYLGWVAWLAGIGLEVKQPSLSGGEQIDAVLAAAHTLETL